ncbi:dGTP triphosphohydrolase [Desulfosporosinus nitroreducens]|uniref:dGTP triphosphohydrolase n=1 Tax=Desulfosporosinus nitroreducens TaxID=2018668 RepID=UPI00207C925E|nr:dNTP triphosphohydrolase [Desulfosporosinus nitroreducens]MCO1602803.1 dNTP triphosphohydrolase [Desulfosporosinus nitroreducens]
MSEILMKCIDLEKSKNGLIKKWGYKHPEKLYEEETYRTNFRRQRDRILYTGGFRRLQDKTQVISAMKSGDHRTRLTHTLEVEQIAISLSDALGLNSDLVSAIACGHDVGHTPFGHAVERALNKKLNKQGGFSHAIQSVKYLNEKMRKDKTPKKVQKLQDLIFEGILKHDTDVYVGDYDNRQWDCSQYKLDEAGTLEMQVVYWADKIAYLTHDFEDFYNTEIYLHAKKNYPQLEVELKTILAELTKNPKIKKNIKLFETRNLIRNIIAQLIDQSKKNIKSKTLKPNGIRIETTRLIKEEELKQAKKEKEDSAVEVNYVEYLEVNKIKELEAQLEDIKKRNDKDQQELVDSTIKTVKKIKKNAYMDCLMINFTDEYRKNYKELRKLLDDYYIFSPEITRSDAKAEKIANCLFDDFVANIRLLPLNIRKRIKDKDNNNDNEPVGANSKERIVADYIASMTDRYAEVIYTDLNAIGGNYDY